MNYTELICEKPAGKEELEIIIAELADLGYESFTEEEDRLLAYIPSDRYAEKLLKENSYLSDHLKIHGVRAIKEQNWNAIWESNYEPVVIGDCGIRAPFHPENGALKYDIVIQPKMSFGTAHHETTALIIETLLKENLQGGSVLDMGCGTGVLAILASMMGSAHVTAIDNDEWAYVNTIENCKLNGITNIRVQKGDERLLAGEQDEQFDLVLANINKNVLLKALPAYVGVMKKGAKIILSGFYVNDLKDISLEAEKLGLQFLSSTEKNKWVAASFIKE